MNAPSHPKVTAPQDPASADHVPQILGVLGDKWTILIFHRLTEGPRRFNALRREIPAISQKMLTSSLRNLERNGLVLRTVTPTSPPQVEYSLTEMGSELTGSMCSFAQWAMNHGEEIAEAQRRHDEATASPKA